MSDQLITGSGNYPFLPASLTNITSVDITESTYIRVGNIVSVSVAARVVYSGAGPTRRFTMQLPFKGGVAGGIGAAVNETAPFTGNPVLVNDIGGPGSDDSEFIWDDAGAGPVMFRAILHFRAEG